MEQKQQSLIDLFSLNFSFWDKLTSGQQKTLLSFATEVVFEKGQTIFSSKSDCLGVLIVKSGELRSYLLSDDGKEFTLYRLYGGDTCVLSASCILHNITFDVFINAEIRTEAVLIDSHTFDLLQKESIYLENFVLKKTADRFSDVIWSLEQVIFYKIEQRLAIFLLDESSKNNSAIISLTHENIAKYIGSAREVVSRTLKGFENDGIIALTPKQITIIDKNKLKAML